MKKEENIPESLETKKLRPRAWEGLTHGGKWGEVVGVVMRRRWQQLGFGKECGLWSVWSERLRLERLEIESRENGDWDWEWDSDLWESEILRTVRSLRWDWRLRAWGFACETVEDWFPFQIFNFSCSELLLVIWFLLLRVSLDECSS